MRQKITNRYLNFLTPVVTVLLLIAAAGVSVKATVSSFTNRTFYNAAVSSMGTTKNIDFSQRDDALPITNPSNDINVSSMFLKGAEFVNQRSYFNTMFYNFPNFKSRVYLPANTYAFGVELTRFYGTNGNFTITLSTGDTYTLTGKPGVHYFTFPPNPDFFGITSDQPVQWAEYSFNNDYMVLDNFTYTVNTPHQLSGLVSYWPAENSSVDVRDGNDGILRGGIAFSPGVVRKAFDLDGANRYVEVPDSANLSLTGPMTLEAKIKLNTNSVQQSIIEKYDVPGVNGYLMRIQGGKLSAAMCNTTLAGAQSGVIGATTVSTGVWHHVAAVYDGTTLKVYLDGVLDGSVAANFAPTNGSTSLKIGARGDDAATRFNGLIDDVRIYNRALSEAEIQTAGVMDSTPPVIAPVVTGNLGTNDWYTGNVQVNWNVTEDESAVDSSSGCGVSNVTTDTNGVTFTCTAASLGGSSTQSVTIKRDSTAPIVDPVAKVNGNPYGGGWTNQDVVVVFDCTDATSGVAFQTAPATLSGEGANQSASGSCTDAAGNENSATLSNVNIDKTAPQINTTRSPEANAAGWNNTDVTGFYTASDALSGLDGDSPANGSIVFTSEGPGQYFTFTVTDLAGNSSSANVENVHIDKTAPLVNCGAADGIWHAADVSIACTSSDSLSTLADSADANFNLVTNVPAGTEASNASTDSREVCDKAGNCSTGGSLGGNKIDKKAPSITITAPVGGNYSLNQAVIVNYSCSDGGSGIGSCPGTSPNGGLLDTSSPGVKTFTVAAVDSVGNTATPSIVNYTVGFNLDVLFDQNKAHKAGSTVPVKIRLLDANGLNVSNAGTIVHAVSVVQLGSQASTMVEDAGNSNPDLDFRYDQDSASYIFNLQTKGYSTGTYQLNFIAGNGGVLYSVRFQVRR